MFKCLIKIKIPLYLFLLWSCVCSAKLKSSPCEKSLIHSGDTVQIEIPQRTAEEAQLKASGYNSAFTRGQDVMREWIIVGEQLREQEVDGYRVRIPHYAKDLSDNIAYMEEGIVNDWQLEKFEELKQYMNPIIDKGEVTYFEWLKINFYSIEILSGREALQPYAYKLADKFPAEIAMPTIIGEPGIMPLNRGWGREIHPIGMTNRWRSVHGSNRDPVSLAGHDILHIQDGRRTQPLFHERLMERVESLPVEERKNVELGYNAITRENFSRTSFIENPEAIRSDITSALNTFVSETKDGRGLIDVSDGKEQAIQEVADDFMGAFHEIQSSDMRD